jgi:hypothetical protein
VSDIMMNWLQEMVAGRCCVATLFAVVACSGGPGVDDSSNAVIDPPQECSQDRPDCWVSSDFPGQGDLDETNSAGVRYSQTTRSLVIDRASDLPDSDLDGVPDDADDCPTMPGWRMPCDGDPANDGIYQVLFFDPLGTPEAVRTSIITTTADVPAVDIYFLVDGTSSMAGEIDVLQDEITAVISDIEALFDDPRLGLGLFREYPIDPLAMPYSQAPYHHILDLTDDTLLFEKAVSTLDTVANMTNPEAGSQALFAVASGQGLGDFVPNRAPCPGGQVGYACFRPNVLRLVLNITDAQMYNGPVPSGPMYDPFVPARPGVSSLPPVQMFPALFDADDAVAALNLGDLSTQSLTLMGMSSLLSNQVNTAIAPGCQTQSGMPPGDDMDDKDVVITFRFDSPSVTLADAFANNTHWPGANVALFDDAMLDPAMTLGCNGDMATSNWGAIQWTPATEQHYYIVADGQVPAGQSVEPEGAFSLSIIHDGDPAPNPAWLTADAPVDWAPVEAALLANDIRVASVLSPKDALTTPSDGDADARAVATATGAVTKVGEWVGEITAPDGEGLGAQVTNTLSLILDESVYDIQIVAVENAATPTFDETDFVDALGAQDCAEGEPLECGSPSMDRCPACEPGADIEFELRLLNDSVAQAATSQVFDFEIIIWVDDTIELDRIPVRVMVPNDATFEFDDTPGANFYRNDYDSTDERCITPPEGPEHPKWGDLTWEGSTPGDSTIEFQIRTAATVAELQTAIPAVVVIPTDTEDNPLNLTNELIADGQPWGLPYIQITAVLTPSTSPPATPTLKGWTFEFVCEAAE